jgi:hypothetical protein
VKILCSSCHDETGRDVSGIVPQSICAQCGRHCMGYGALEVR